MARKRFHELINSKRARVACFEKRKKGLKKAAYELSTLCGVDISMIVVCNNESDVWPPNWDTVSRMMKVHNLGSGQDEKCRTYGVHDYLKEKREKLEEEINKMREKRKFAKGDDGFESFSHDQLRELGSFLRAKIGAVRETIESRVEQQQILAYHNNLVESRNPYLNTEFTMNPYRPEIIQHNQNLAQYEAQNNPGNQNEMKMIMMKSDGASCSQGIYNFDGVQDNYACFVYENRFQNCGIQTEMMENVGMNEVEPLMSYHMPNEELMLQNWQGLISMSDFPEVQADQQGWEVQADQQGYYYA